MFFFDRVSPANLVLAAKARENGSLVVFEPPRCAVDAVFFKAISLSHFVKYASTTLGRNLVDGLTSICNDAQLPDLEVETLGSEGLRYRLKGRKWETLSSVAAASVVDTTGAGDWLTAAFLNSLASSEHDIINSLKDADAVHQHLHSAQKVAAYNCQYIGARGAMDLMDSNCMMSEVNKQAKPVDTRVQNAGIENSHPFSCNICLNP